MDKQLLDLKNREDLRKCIQSTHKFIKTDTNNIVPLDEIDERHKGEWIEHDEQEFAKVFNGLLDFTKDDEEYDNLDWNSVNYEVYGADYYQEKFPGFSEEIYEILAKSTDPESKIVDNRIPPLKVTREPITLNFD